MMNLVVDHDSLDSLDEGLGRHLVGIVRLDFS